MHTDHVIDTITYIIALFTIVVSLVGIIVCGSVIVDSYFTQELILRETIVESE